jgi:hypothetical protein
MRGRPCSVLLLAVVASPACLPFFIPHEVTMNPEITGTVVEQSTRRPVAGARIRVAGTRLETQTKDTGEFTIPETTSWDYVWFFPLLPFDGFPRTTDLLVDLPRPRPADWEVFAFEFRYEPPTRIIADTGRKNRENPVRFGTIAISRGL